MDHMVQGVTEESLDEGPGKGVEISCYSNGEGKEIRAKIVVDASGASAVIGRQLGLVDSSSDRHGHGVEFEMEGADMEQEESMVLKFDHRYAPGGYAWIFDTGEGTAKVGVCAYSGYQELHEDESLGLEQRFERFVEEDPRLGEAEKIEKDGSFEKHMGSAFVDYMERKVEDNIILIGDTVSSLEPIAGQGIDNCMVSGREAAVAATHALETDKFCRENLSRYEERWEDQLGNKEDEVRAALIIYSLSDRTMESLLKSLEQFKEEKVHRLINDADMAVIAEILAKKPILLAYIFQDIFRARKLLWNLFRD
jgi:digeranylgeranylglycerophospholipid reductase